MKKENKTWEDDFDERFGRFYFGKDANSEETFDWEKSGTEKTCICSGNIKGYIQANFLPKDKVRELVEEMIEKIEETRWRESNFEDWGKSGLDFLEERVDIYKDHNEDITRLTKSLKDILKKIDE